MPGFADIVLLLIVAMFVFGTSKLPKIATAMGRQIVKWRKPPSEAEQEIAEDEEAEREQAG